MYVVGTRTLPNTKYVAKSNYQRTPYALHDWSEIL